MRYNTKGKRKKQKKEVMPVYYSPLRYPGGKRKLAPLIRKMIEKTGKKVYIEPFAGGASVALELIETGAVDRIVLNDSDIRIYAFWKEVLDETDRFVKTIETVPLTIEEWKKQREICMNPDDYSLFDIGFSTFYMNRTNRSGILKGGVMGGKSQNGSYTMDTRFNREHLAERIRRVAEKKDCIDLYNSDVRDFIDDIFPKYADRAFCYFDPAYVKKGSSVYMKSLKTCDHIEIAQTITNLKDNNWIITYDNEQIIKDIGREIMIFGNKMLIPDQAMLSDNRVNMKLTEVI